MDKFGEFTLYMTGIIVETVPFITLAALMSFVLAFIPGSSIQKIFRGRKIVSIFIAAAAGFVIPLCECSIVPIVARFARRKLPLPVAVTFMVAAPSLSPIVVAVTSVAFAINPGIIYLRFGTAFALSVATGLIFLYLDRDGRLSGEPFPDEPAEMCDCAREKHGNATIDEKIKDGFEDAVGDFSRTLGYIVMAAAITAAVKVFVPTDIIATVGSSACTSVPAMMMFSFILSTCSDADAFIPAAMTDFSNLSKLAFLLTGPVIDLKLTIMHFAFLPRRTAFSILIVFPALVVAAVIVLSFFI
ncbi:MAG TPA: permease [bacterium]|nr:permease [bacterium]